MKPNTNHNDELSIYCDWLEDQGRCLESSWLREDLTADSSEWYYEYSVIVGVSGVVGGGVSGVVGGVVGGGVVGGVVGGGVGGVVGDVGGGVGGSVVGSGGGGGVVGGS